MAGVFAAWDFFENIPPPQEPPPIEIFIRPVTVLKEAEDCDFTGKIIFDTSASNSSTIEREAEGNGTSISCEAPRSSRPLAVWLRRKGGPIHLENQEGEKLPQTVSKIREEPLFVWTLMGEFNPQQQPATIVFKETVSSAPPASVDCILFTDQKIEDKDSFLTSVEPLEIDPTWATSDFRNASEAWGFNLPPTEALFARATSRVVRVTLPDWDEDRFRKMTAGLLELENTRRIILNFPNWPEAMDADADGFLDQKNKDAYIELVRRFAEIALEGENAANRFYFELFDRLDQQYYTDLVAKKETHRVADLARIYLAIAAEIHTINPKAKVGGAAAGITADTGFHDQFIAITAPALDFYSIQSDANRGGELIYTIKGYLKKNSAERNIPLIISASQHSEAVLDAWFLIKAFSNGADCAIATGSRKPGEGEGEDSGSRLLYETLEMKFSSLCAAFHTSEPDSLAALTSQDRNSLFLAHNGTRARDLILPPGSWTGFLLKDGAKIAEPVKISTQFLFPKGSALYLERED